MVLAERSGGDNTTRNNCSGGGRRSRAPSPNNNNTNNNNNNNSNNGNYSDDSNDSNDSDHGMRVGNDYQAVITDALYELPAPEHEPDKAVLVWSPCNGIPDAKLDEYLSLAKEKYNYNHEQALGMLFWHKFNLEKAMADMPNFTPFPDDWTVEDKVLFEQAFQFHDKHFHKIKQMLPDKSIASLVKYYYSWKKTRSRTSLMDRQARKLTSQKDDASDGGSEAGSDNESDSGNGTNQNEAALANVKDGKPICSNCFTTTSGHFHNTNKGLLCKTCYSYWRRTGSMKTTNNAKKNETTSSTRHNPIKPRKPPRGMHLNYDDLMSIASGPPGQGESILKALDSEVITLKRQVQNNKQIISQLKHKTAGGIDEFRPPENTSRINARWTNEECLLGVQGIRKYGLDFKAIAEVIGNKNEAHVKQFFANNQKRYKLNAVLKEYDAEHGISDNNSNEKGDSNNTDNNNSVPQNNNSSIGSAPPPLKPIPSSSSTPTSGSGNSNSRPPRATLLPHNPPPLTSSSSSLRTTKA